MTPTERLVANLAGVKRSGNGWTARCPAHDDGRASLSVSAGDDGRALVRCHAGCSVEAIVAAVGLATRDLMPERDAGTPARSDHTRPAKAAYPTANAAVAELERRHGKRAATWTYTDAAGSPVGLVVRWDSADGGKDIRPVSRCPGGWRVGALPAPRPLYHLPELAVATRVLVVEGEKAAVAARRLGFTTTTSAGGSQTAAKTDWSPLAGKRVVLLPDNAPPGRKYADAVTSALATLTPASVVRVVELPDLPPGGDIVDWVAAQGPPNDHDDLRSRVEHLAEAVEPEGTALPPADGGVFQPFPVDALPTPLQQFVAAGARAIGCDPSYLALPLLAALAAAVGTTRRLLLKRGWTVPAIIWAAIVGESGTAKSPAFKLVMRPVRERQRRALDRHAEVMQQHEADLARWEKKSTAWKREKNAGDDPPATPAPPDTDRYVVSDTTVEALAPILMANPRGLLLSRDELAGWFGSFDRYAAKAGAGTDAANWLSMFNAEGIIVDRKSGLPRTVHVPQAAVCVTGGIQPGILKRALGRNTGSPAWPPACSSPARPAGRSGGPRPTSTRPTRSGWPGCSTGCST